MAHSRSPSLLLAALLVAASAALAGCVVTPQTNGTVREIRMWVEPMDWSVHPNVTTPVWAFCAEGDGVEPVWDGPCGVPGPTIHVAKGDLIRLTFENTHSIPHTVHFHGWHKFMADMNGAAYVGGHMLVQPGESHLFEWVAEPAGTFIYHCHFQTPTHMDMGMYGAFIVDDPRDPADVDHDYVTVIDEWAIHNESRFVGNMPDYNFFTINGKSFPTTQAWLVDKGDRVRVHMVNAGFEFHAMHLHGYTPDSWEGVAGWRHAVPTDVRQIAPGQSIVLDFDATREGIWLFHDHVVPRVTAASDGSGFGAYPRGMLTVLAVGDQYHDALRGAVPELLAAAAADSLDPEASHNGHGHGDGDAGETPSGGETIDMKGYAYTRTDVTVPAGTTVTWSNKDPVVHTVTAADGSFDSGNIGAGGTWSRTFTEPGTYQYYCIPHSYQDKGTWKGMVASITVTAS